MVDQRIVDYIISGLRQGHSLTSLKQSLMQQGWIEADIDQAIQIAQGGMAQVPPRPGQSKEPKGHTNLIIIIVVVFVALFIMVIFSGAALFALGILNPATYQQKRCNGFQYFTYMDQGASNLEFTIQLRNGVNDIQITDMQVGSVMNTDPEVSAQYLAGWLSQGREFTVKSGGVSLPLGNYDDLVVTITYDVKNGITGNTDTATCVGNSL